MFALMIFDTDHADYITVVVVSNCCGVISVKSRIILSVWDQTTPPNARKRTKFGYVCLPCCWLLYVCVGIFIFIILLWICLSPGLKQARLASTAIDGGDGGGGHWLVRMEWRPAGWLVSASVNLPLHHKVQKFSSGTGSPVWSRKKGRKMVVV